MTNIDLSVLHTGIEINEDCDLVRVANIYCLSQVWRFVSLGGGGGNCFKSLIIWLKNNNRKILQIIFWIQMLFQLSRF